MPDDAITILLVEDDAEIRVLLHHMLRQAGYTTLCASSCNTALTLLKAEFVHLVLLDWMLGKDDGMELFRVVRSTNSLRDVPFILLTARSNVEDQVYGLDQGVADYIVKPFDSQTLLARIRSCLQHHPRTRSQLLKAGRLTLDLEKNRLSLGDARVKIDPSDARLLGLLMRRIDVPVKRSRLLKAITISNQQIELRTADVHISRLRKKLAKLGAANLLVTLRSKGYMLVSGMPGKRPK